MKKFKGSDVTVAENLFVEKDLTVTGDLTVNGATTAVNTATLDVTDTNITVNKGGNDASSEAAGITVERTGTDGSFVYEDALATKWKGGALGSEVEFVGTTSTQTLSNKTISGANNTLTVRAADLDSGAAGAGEVATADGASGVTYATPSTAPDHAYDITNASIATGFGGGALTISLVTKAGATPTGGDPVKIAYRDTDEDTGTYEVVTTSSATSITITSGATLGHTSAKDEPIYVYALNFAGVTELAVSRSPNFNEGETHTTTLIAASSDDGQTLYTTAGRTGEAIRLITKLITNEATAGNWTQDPIRNAPPQFDHNSTAVLAHYNLGANQSIADDNELKVDMDTAEFEIGGISNDGTGTVTVPKEGIYRVSAKILYNGATFAINEFATMRVFVNGTVRRNLRFWESQATTSGINPDLTGSSLVECNKDDTIEIHTRHNQGSAVLLIASNNGSAATYVDIEWVGPK